MARLSRLFPVHLPQHIIQRGNNRQVCFAGEQDYIAYSGWLKAYAAEYHAQSSRNAKLGVSSNIPTSRRLF